MKYSGIGLVTDNFVTCALSNLCSSGAANTADILAAIESAANSQALMHSLRALALDVQNFELVRADSKAVSVKCEDASGNVYFLKIDK